MWSKEEAIECVRKKWLPLGNECSGEMFVLDEDSTESWEHGWIFKLLHKEKFVSERYIVDRRYKICHPVGA